MTAPERARRLALACAGIALLAFITAIAWRLDRRSNRPAKPRVTPNLPADRVSARRGLVAARGRAAAARDFRRVAELDAILAQEALVRAHRAEVAWRGARDPATGLVPRGLQPRERVWNAKDTAADLLPHLILAAKLLAPEESGLWLAALAKDREICGPLSGTVGLGVGPAPRVAAETSAARVFGAAEYAKDGLLPLVERLGPGPWLDRLREIADVLIEQASVRAPGTEAPIPSAIGEVNGDVLQVLARLGWLTRDERYLAMLERIVEVYLFRVIPANGGLPPGDFDLVEGRARKPDFRLADHGNEILVGLAEAYVLERGLGRPGAERWREPLRRLLDLCLEIGRTADGLFVTSLDPRTRAPVDPRPTDNYGYVLAAYAALDLADGTSDYTPEIERALRAAAARRSFPWEGNGHDQDGFADAIESMLYLLPFFPIEECAAWVDDEIEVLFAKQAPSGFVEERYLDGNFIRTALLYAGYKSQGAAVEPWRADVALGAARDPVSGALHVRLESDRPFAGRLRFDIARHRAHLGLAFEYPRLNGTPEWFVVDPGARYEVARETAPAGPGAPTLAVDVVPGATLAQGLPVTLGEPDGAGRGGVLSLRVRRLP